MRVMIVDDEIHMRARLKNMIETISPQAHSLFEARNGQEAINLIEKVPIDLVFLDIQMPVMDGLTFIDYYKDRSRSFEIVVISGFAEYELVRKALILGAMDYIHKPILQKAEIEKLLTVVMEKQTVTTQQAETGQVYQLHEEVMQEVYLRKLISESHESSFYQRCADVLNMTEIKAVSVTFIYRSDFVTEDGEDEERVYKAVNHILKELIGVQENTFYVHRTFGELVLILNYPQLQSEHEILTRTGELVQRICKGLIKYASISAITGISSVKYVIEAMSDAYMETQVGLSALFYQPEATCIRYDEVYDSGALEGVSEQIQPLIHSMLSALLGNRFEEAEDLLCTLFEVIKQHRLEAGSAKDILREIQYLLTYRCHELNQDGGAYKTQKIQVKNSFYLEELFGQMLDYLNYIKQLYVRELEEKKKGHYSYQAIQYIKCNYMNDLSLDRLCEVVNLNPSYLSRVFKKEMGQTITNYINEIRIKQSQKLLKETNLKVYEIAEKVGYTSVDNFNYVFRNAMNKTPKEYRRSL